MNAASVSTDLAMVRQLAAPALVIVSRETHGWQAEVAALGVVVRNRRSLYALDQRVRDLLGTSAVDYQFHTGDAELDRFVVQIRAATSAARTADARAGRLILQVLMLPGGGSGRDLAVLLGMTHQRVQQRRRAQLSTVESE